MAIPRESVIPNVRRFSDSHDRAIWSREMHHVYGRVRTFVQDAHEASREIVAVFIARINSRSSQFQFLRDVHTLLSDTSFEHEFLGTDNESF